MADKKKQLQQEELEPLAQQESLQFKPGEYLVHILLQQTRALQNPNDNESTIDPLIQIETMDQKKFSSQKKGTGSNSTLVWNEHFYFKRSFSNGWQIQSQHVKISVLDHKVFGRNAIVGIYELDFSTIYMTDNHVLLHKWLGLINPEKDFNKITGYLKISINIVHDADKQTTLVMDNEIKERGKIEEAKNNLFAEGELLLPPHIQTKGQQLKITLGRATNLMKMDSMLGSIDPYLLFEIGGQEIQTDLIKNNNAPNWELNLFLPVMTPCQSEYIIMRLFDYDMGGKDEIAGSQLFRIPDILSGQLSQPKWFHIYGAHIDADSEQRVYLCSHPDLGTCYAGRILLSMELIDSEQPKKDKQKIADQKTLQKIREDLSYQWSFQCIVYFALNLPVDDDSYSIKIKWGENECKTSSEKAKNGVVEYYKYLTIENVKFPTKEISELPDVFIYLMDGDKPICFKRYKSYNLNPNEKYPDGHHFTVTLIPDKSLKNTPMDHPGIVKIKLLIQPTGGLIKMQPVTKPQRDANSFLYVNLFQAHDLAPTDMDGLADPIVDVLFYDQKQTTVLINDTTAPIWNTQLRMPVYKFENESFPPIILKIFDQDKVSRDFMGQLTIDYQKGLKQGFITKNQAHITKPQWIDVYLYGSKAGQVLLSCNYIDNISVKIPNQISPHRIKHFIKIKLLGLRNLKSFGPLPVTKAFAKFNVQSIRAKDEPLSLNNANEIITQPKEAGPNPNISSIICLEINLPEDDAFMPKFIGSVHDYILKGILQPLIGQFSIDLKLQKLKTLKQIEEKKDIAKRVLNGTIQVDSNIIHLPSLDLGVGIKMGALLSMASGEQFNEDISNLLTQLGVLKNNAIYMDQIIKYIEYDKNEEEGTFIEVDRPDSKYYLPLGYDTQIQKAQLYLQRKKLGGQQIQNKSLNQVEIQIKSSQQGQQGLIKSNVHYRLCLPCPLEDTLFMQQKVFDIFPLRKGSINLREVESMAEIILGVKENQLNTGKLKGWVEVLSQQDLDKLQSQAEFKLIKNEYDFTSGKSDTNLTDKELVVKNQVTIRLYIIDCSNLPPKDQDSMSDPYLKIRLGKESIDDVANRVIDNCNPQYYKRYDITTELPGASELIIQVWDYDDFIPDDLIGQTIIDVEERYFQSRFRQLKQIPIETRQLIHPSSSMPQGQIRLFLEIIPSKQTSILKNPWFIEQRPKAKHLIRCVVWDVLDVPSHDDEGSSDLYVVGFVDQDQKQKTDTHFRSFNGKGSFNWRMVFPIELPQQQQTILTFQIFDKDIFTSDDFISDCSIDITDLCRRAFENEINVKMYSKTEPPTDGILKQDALTKQTNNGILYEKNVIQTINSEKAGYKSNQQNGKLVVSIEIVQEQFHNKNPVGLGRSQPNHSPVCPEPTGRIEWTWNPFKMLSQLLGPKAIRYLLLAICIMFAGYMLVMLFPIITGNLVTRIFTG
ncbi:unnamed protein product [Paramecium sonneborni]|uniref:C2 domain-containing protein n=1 Tax=Paramecium sonneborni TaxID=65129 RepID=A0A8S1N763_9CILI|nr:unnamed protein product [Paramecium sonneborni]